MTKLAARIARVATPLVGGAVDTETTDITPAMITVERTTRRSCLSARHNASKATWIKSCIAWVFIDFDRKRDHPVEGERIAWRSLRQWLRQ